MIACQVSGISDEFWIYQNLKTRHLNVLPAINGALVFELLDLLSVVNMQLYVCHKRIGIIQGSFGNFIH